MQRWQRREPGAWSAWQKVAALGGAQADARLREADTLYQAGVSGLEEGSAEATELLRRGAQIAPIAPTLYLRLARACRAQGAFVRAADFYRKFLGELPERAERLEAEHELSQIAREIGDPFSPGVPTDTLRWVVGGAALLVLALVGVVVFVLVRRSRRPRIESLLVRHPERANAFVYVSGVMRHELLKHRLSPLRVAGPLRDSLPVDPITLGWHRHLDMLAAALGVPRATLYAEPVFQRAERAIAEIGRAERAHTEAPAAALVALAALERALIQWARLVERTALDCALFDGLIESLRDERPDRKLDVAIDVVPSELPVSAVILSHDLLLVLRNLVRNAITAATAVGAAQLRIETLVHVDETGEEWARVVIHDPSAARPPADRPPDRGLGLVRATLDRYGGALLEAAPAGGFQKALVVSLPRAEEAELASPARAREAA